MEQSYKEKYEQALAKAKEQYNYPCMRSCMGILEEIFPELAKSEDEKVRKEIIRFIQMEVEDEIVGNKWLAWLGKQGEKHQNPYNGISFEYNGHIWGMCARDNGVDISCDKHLIKHLEKQGEQTHANWSGDEKVRKALIDFFGKGAKYGGQTNGVYDKDILAWLERQGEQKTITFNNAHIIDPALNDYCCKQYNALHKENGGVLSFARLQHLAMDIYGWCKEYLQGEQEPEENKGNIGGNSSNWSEEDECYMSECIGAIATKDGWSFDEKRKTKHWLKSLKDRVLSQPKQEWSEEDKYMYDILCGTIENTDINENTKYTLISWLKSLRPHNRWKPSDSQSSKI